MQENLPEMISLLRLSMPTTLAPGTVILKVSRVSGGSKEKTSVCLSSRHCRLAVTISYVQVCFLFLGRGATLILPHIYVHFVSLACGQVVTTTFWSLEGSTSGPVYELFASGGFAAHA